MIRTVTPPITPFVDPLPLPSRLIAAAHDGRLTVRLRAGRHRFHRDLPASEIWGFDGTVPGPTIEAERGQPVTVMWQNELDGAFPVTVMTMKSQKPSDARHSNAGVAAGAACH